MVFKKQVYIEAPVQTVFHLVTDINSMIHIMDSVIDVQLLTEGPIQKGSKMKEVREIRGGRTVSKLEVIEYIPNEKYIIKSENSGLIIHYIYTFQSDGKGTVVEFKNSIQTTGMRNALLEPIIRWIIKREDRNNLRNLKKYLDKSI